EGAGATRLERHRIEFPWQALFAKGKERPMIRIDADVPRGLERNATFHLIRGKGGAKRAKNGMTGLFFGDELVCPHEAIGEVDAVTLKPQGAAHAVAVEPVTIPQSRPCEPGWAIEIVRPPDEIRNLAGAGFDGVLLLTQVE